MLGPSSLHVCLFFFSLFLALSSFSLSSSSYPPLPHHSNNWAITGFVNGNMGSSVVGVQCDQVVTTKAAIGAHGTYVYLPLSFFLPPFIHLGVSHSITILFIYLYFRQMAVSPSYQLSYGSLPFIAPGKLSGLTFKTQFYNALAYVIPF